ncbi:LysR family transcriptional regulator [Pseudomonas sp. App30]|uniref:LysR family transcriptional regulator n=1 Tax=Pseudomonas sp. App30 TaxID=3068990 RepID=UPI003A7FCF35
MNWDDTRFFLALCRERTLRGAARQLGVDQATVGRRIAALEEALAATLFLRSSDGYRLTSPGEAAYSAAVQMEHSAHDLQRRIQGLDDLPSGQVRLATTDSLAVDFVIPALARLRLQHPQVQVDVKASTQMLNLARREADLAIRTVKPDNPDLLVRRLAAWPVGLFASADYVQRHGVPEPGNGFAGHAQVAWQPYVEAGRASTLLDEPAHGAQISCSASTSLLVRQAVAAGLGLSELPVLAGERDGLVRVWPQRVRAQPYEVWLVSHADLRHTARVNVVVEALVAAFSTPTAGPDVPG